ncbi:rRNA maturation RNase YbeY [bacterium]|nr:rRNA maturation RNase YbeY [bacterium]
MSVELYDEYMKLNLPMDALYRFIKKVTRDERYESNVRVVYIDSDRMRELNYLFLGKDEDTDVLSFPVSGETFIADNVPTEEEDFDEVYISVDKVLENAQEYKTDFTYELFLVTLHGILHLVGFDDQTEEERKCMREREDFYMERYKDLWNING